MVIVNAVVEILKMICHIFYNEGYGRSFESPFKYR